MEFESQAHAPTTRELLAESILLKDSQRRDNGR